MFNTFFDDAAVEEFFKRDDVILSSKQRKIAERLVKLMRQLSDETTDQIDREIDPADFLRNPRLAECREAAAEFLNLFEHTSYVKSH